jgi:hypothetical protein
VARTDQHGKPAATVQFVWWNHMQECYPSLVPNQYQEITHYLGTQIDVTHRGKPEPNDTRRPVKIG